MGEKESSMDISDFVVIQLEYAHKLHLHQDNLRYSILKFYFIYVGAILTLVDKLDLKDINQIAIYFVAFFFGFLMFLLFAIEHYFFMKYKKWIRIAEEELLKYTKGKEPDLQKFLYATHDKIEKIYLPLDPSSTLILLVMAMANSIVLLMGFNALLTLKIEIMILILTLSTMVQFATLRFFHHIYRISEQRMYHPPTPK